MKIGQKVTITKGSEKHKGTIISDYTIKGVQTMILVFFPTLNENYNLKFSPKTGIQITNGVPESLTGWTIDPFAGLNDYHPELITSQPNF